MIVFILFIVYNVVISFCMFEICANFFVLCYILHFILSLLYMSIFIDTTYSNYSLLNSPILYL
jgi:hypothetical protein